MDSDAAFALGAAGLATFGLMGSLHCAGMCGPLAASACWAAAGTWRRRDAALYLLTRAVCYGLLGVAVGLASALTLRRWLDPLGLPLALVLAVAMLAYGLLELARAVLALRRGVRYTPAVKPAAASPFATALARLPVARPLALGVATALLPCGFLYGALTQAALIAHPAWSGAGMIGFALASSPTLLAGSGLLAWLERRVPRLKPFLVSALLVLTALSLLWRAGIGGHHHHS